MINLKLNLINVILFVPIAIERYITLLDGLLSTTRTCDLRIRNPALYPTEL